MSDFDFSRFATDNIIIEVDSLFDGIITITRDDDVDVDLTGKVIKMDIMRKYGEVPVASLLSGVDFILAGSSLIFDRIFSELTRRGYVFEIYNDTDSISIAKARLEAL